MSRNQKKKHQRNRLPREIRSESLRYHKEEEPFGEEEEDLGYNPHLKAAILEVVENQLRANNPPEVRQTFERLLAAGHSRQEAMELIGSVVVTEIWHILREEREFDREFYKSQLDQLS
jgi:hypothetical protein